MAKKEIAVTKIILKMGSVEVELSVEEARELQKTLGKLFEKEVEYVPYYKPYSVPYKPWWDKPTITWGTGTGQTDFSCLKDNTVKVSMENMASARLLSQ